MRSTRCALLLLLLAGGCLNPLAIRQADRLVEDGDYVSAIAAYERLLSERSDTDLSEKLTEVRHLESDRLHKEGLQRLSEGAPEAAFDTLVQALTHDGRNLDALDALAVSRDQLLDKASRYERSARWPEAAALYAKILTQYKRNEAAQNGLSRVNLHQAKSHHADGLRKRRTRPATALIHFLHAHLLAPGAQDSQQQATEILNDLHQESRHKGKVEVRTPKGRSLQGSRWTRTLKLAMVAHGVTTSAHGPHAPGVQVMVELELISQTHDRQVLEVPRQEQVTTYTSDEPNPAYNTAHQALDQASAKAEGARTKLIDADAQLHRAKAHLQEAPGSSRALDNERLADEALGKARATLRSADDLVARRQAELAETAPFLGERQDTLVEWTEMEGTSQASLHWEGRCTVQRQTPIQVPLHFDETLAVTDSGHPALPALGHAEDPFELPTPEALVKALTTQAEEALTSAVGQCITKDRDKLWEEVARVQDLGWEEPAADAMLRAWLNDPTHGEDRLVGYLTTTLGAPEASLRALLSEHLQTRG